VHVTYILKSNKDSRYYIGCTKDINERLRMHNSGKVISTKRFIPWTLYYKEEYNSNKEARRRELQLKSWKSRKSLERLKFL